MLKISHFSSEKDNQPVAVEVQSFTDLAKYLADNARKGQKYGTAWSPAVFKGTRSKANVVEVSCLVLDIDDSGEEGLRQAREFFKGFEYIYHTTHTPGRYRFLVALEKPCPADSFPALWSHVARNVEIDEAACDASRLYFYPTTADLEGEVVIQTSEGALFPVEFAPINITSIQAEAKGDDELTGLIRGTWTPSEGKRHSEMTPLVGRLAHMSDMTRDKGLLILEQAIHRMQNEPSGPRSFEARFNDVRSMFLASFERAQNLRHDKELSSVTALELVKEPVTHVGKPAFEWYEKGLLEERDGVRKLRRLASNVLVVLRNDPEFASVRFNERSQEMEADEGALKDCDLNSAGVVLANYLETSAHALSFSVSVCFDQLGLLLKERSYDPVKKFLEGLVWDRTPRLDFFSEKCLKPVSGSPQLNRKIGVKFMISAVARALSPGCQVDTMLILTGAGGVGKTSFVRELAGGHYSSLSYSVGNKDSYMQIAKAWIVEMAELSAMRKSDRESFRGFITDTQNDYRPPYARAVVSQKRACVFVGTSNDESPISDVEGLRRYWPMEVKSIDLKWLRENREQLFAEAVVRYREGEPYWLNQDEMVEMTEQSDNFVDKSHLSERIFNWFMEQPLNEREKYYSLPEIAKEVFMVGAADYTKKHQMSIFFAVRELGFVKRTRYIGKFKDIRYRVPDSMLAMARVTSTGNVLTVKEAHGE